MKIFIWIVGALTAVVRFLDLRLRWKEKTEKSRKEKEVLDAVSDARKKVVEGDQEGLNRIIEETREKRGARLITIQACNRRPTIYAKLTFVGLVVLAVSIILAMSLCQGCMTRTVVVPADRQVVRMHLDNTPGWFVPDALMSELMENYVKIARFNYVEDEIEQNKAFARVADEARQDLGIPAPENTENNQQGEEQ